MRKYCNQLHHYQKYSKNDLIFRRNCTWDSAIVRTIGSTMGCITSLRSSAHNGGSTFIPHQVHQKPEVKSIKLYWIFSNWEVLKLCNPTPNLFPSWRKKKAEEAPVTGLNLISEDPRIEAGPHVWHSFQKLGFLHVVPFLHALKKKVKSKHWYMVIICKLYN